PDPFRVATYSLRTHNRIVGGQLGFDWENPVPYCHRWLAFGWYTKGAWGVNFLDVDVTLTRGDGFEGPPGHRSTTQFAHLYETAMFLDLFFTDRCRLRMGYTALWAVQVAEGIGQFSFDLAQRVGNPNDNGSIFYHGPMVEFHFLF